jgi:hypothetical protein
MRLGLAAAHRSSAHDRRAAVGALHSVADHRAVVAVRMELVSHRIGLAAGAAGRIVGLVGDRESRYHLGCMPLAVLSRCSFLLAGCSSNRSRTRE